MPPTKIKNPKKFRQNIAANFVKLFANTAEPEKNAINVEKGILNWALKEAANRRVIKKWDNPYFIQIYCSHLHSILRNLTKNNTYLITLLNQGHVTAQEIPFMTHYEMCPQKWDVLIKAKQIRDKNKYEQDIEAMTDRYTCNSCYSKRCTYYQLQIRSPDEGLTTYVNCLDCGNRMKHN